MNATATATPWWSGEEVLALHEVPHRIPPRTDGRRRSTSSVYRWSVAGVAGVRLRRFKAAGRGWATTAQELARWQAAVSAICGEAAR